MAPSRDVGCSYATNKSLMGSASPSINTSVGVAADQPYQKAPILQLCSIMHYIALTLVPGWRCTGSGGTLTERPVRLLGSQQERRTARQRLLPFQASAVGEVRDSICTTLLRTSREASQQTSGMVNGLAIVALIPPIPGERGRRGA